ncbi:hypothetical protein GCM10022255_069260 [Dactylosporangium darangshiense]|uniref:Uncharacterized protein n=1 Tax=Dactylosporangium darangshiense TaxID=579108 RepID=A0ABP8DI79_9ACTN
MLLLAVGAATDRWLLPADSGAASNSGGPGAGGGVRLVDGVPVGYPATARGAGDAAARFETLLTAAGTLEHRQAIALAGRLCTADAAGLAEQLVPAVPRDAATIQQSTTVRVWAAHATDTTTLPVGVKVDVQTYVLVLLGTSADQGGAANPTAGSPSARTTTGTPAATTPGATLAPSPTGNPSTADGSGPTLAAGWLVHDATMQLTASGWRIAAITAPVPVPPGASDAAARRDGQLLAKVFGPDSWVPST